MPELKHRWSIEHNLLSGITFGKWFRLLAENRFSVGVAYPHRIAFLSALSVMNSAWGCVESVRFGRAIAKTKITNSPLFVLGHWRSGTTHLHNLIAQDTQNFAYPNTYQVVNPYTFLSTERIFSKLFANLLPETRPMDNMAMTFQSPQEDEIALCLLSLRSLYLGVSFPRAVERYMKYLTFAGTDEADLERWKSAMDIFFRKVTLRTGGKSLVIKSPSHTARVRHLLEMYPDAKFVHIHRDPYAVFRSSQHYYDTAGWYIYLQSPTLSTIDDQIIRRYRLLYDAFFEDVPSIPKGNFYEMRFEDLESDPLGQMEAMYDGLGLSGFARAAENLEAYLATIKSYKKNTLDEMPETLRQRVAQAWQPCFEAWDYPI